MTEGACGLQAAFKKAPSSGNSTTEIDWAAVKTEDKTLMHQVCSIIPLPSLVQLTDLVLFVVQLTSFFWLQSHVFCLLRIHDWT